MNHTKLIQEIADILEDIEVSQIHNHCQKVDRRLRNLNTQWEVNDRTREEISNLLNELNSIPMRSPYE